MLGSLDIHQNRKAFFFAADQFHGPDSFQASNGRNLRRDLVRPERFELPTYCSGGHVAQEINKLAGFVRSWSNQHQSWLLVLSVHRNTSRRNSTMGTILVTQFM